MYNLFMKIQKYTSDLHFANQIIMRNRRWCLSFVMEIDVAKHHGDYWIYSRMQDIPCISKRIWVCSSEG